VAPRDRADIVPYVPRRYVIGVDVGASSIKGAVVDTVKGRLSAVRREVPTPVPSTPEAIATTVAMLVESWSCSGPLGVALPCIVHSGTARTAGNIDPSWIGTDVVDLFAKYLPGREVAILNDADAAGVAEGRYGAARASTGIALVLTFGTGIGSALIVDGDPVPHTEFGQILVDGSTAERWASASARRAERLTWHEWSGRVTRLLEVVGDVEIEAGRRLTSIVIGGGVSCAAARWQGLTSANVPITPAGLLKNSGIVGAAIAANEELHSTRRWVEAEKNFGSWMFPPFFDSPDLFPVEFRYLCRAAAAQTAMPRLVSLSR
jgi:polyphosphate glucokinase